MKKIIILSLITFLSTLSKAQYNSLKDIEIIKHLRSDLNKAIQEHNAEAIENFMWNDYSIVRGNSTVSNGKEKVAGEWSKLFKDNEKINYIRIPTEIKISANDTLAWETGNWQGFNTYSKGGNYSAQWKKKNDIWKLQAELYVALY